MSRVDLGDGDWIEFTDRPTHRQYNAIYKAYIAAAGDATTAMDLAATAVATLTTASSIRAEDGAIVDAKTNTDDIPMDKFGLAAAEAIAVFQAVKLPNLSGEKSPLVSTPGASTPPSSPTP